MLRGCTSVAIENDIDLEGSEEFTILLTATNIQGNVLTLLSEATVTILDDDQGYMLLFTVIYA